MFLSCSFFKPQSIEVYTILSKQAVYSYRGDFKLYVDKIEKQRPVNESEDFGRFIHIYYDEQIILKKMNSGTLQMETHLEQYTEGPKILYYFSREPLNGVIGVFANGSVASKISRIVSDVAKNMGKNPSSSVKPVQLLLKDKETAINNIDEFGETVEVRIGDIKDPLYYGCLVKRVIC
ncbi:MAG: hypothetical protein FWG55_05800 [Candidatus Bathyarchaeota archaeon]|nr:hypothetical protein [Candidatus Termiticorpusculum sp.]